MDDEACIRQILLGGASRNAGVADLFRRHASRLRGYFMRQRVSREQADDLVQDVFVNVIRHCANFRGESSIVTWIWSIARNVLVDHYRRQRNAPDLDLDDLLEEGGDPNLQVQPDSGLEECVRKAYAEFARDHRDRAETLALVAFEGWDMTELAAYLKRTPGAVREYVSQCRKKLGPYLERCRGFITG